MRGEGGGGLSGAKTGGVGEGGGGVGVAEGLLHLWQEVVPAAAHVVVNGEHHVLF